MVWEDGLGFSLVEELVEYLGREEFGRGEGLYGEWLSFIVRKREVEEKFRGGFFLSEE